MTRREGGGGQYDFVMYDLIYTRMCGSEGGREEGRFSRPGWEI